MDPLATRVLASVRRQGLIPDWRAGSWSRCRAAETRWLCCICSPSWPRGERSRWRVWRISITGCGRRPPTKTSVSAGIWQPGLACRSSSSRPDVAETARSARISVEHAGHRVRHAFFGRAAGRLGASRVALGHTIDDQAETYLLRLLRGAGAAGFSAIRPRIGPVVRPLLGVSRAELRAYLASRRASFREDASNLDRRVPRNRIRHDLIPSLRAYSPRVVEALAREAEIARADDEWLARAANELGASLVQSTKGGVELDAAGLAALHPALGRRVARDALVRVSGCAVGFDHIETAPPAGRGRPHAGRFPPVPGRAARGCHPSDSPAPVGGRSARVEPFAYRLEVPGEVSVPEAGVDHQRGGRLDRGLFDRARPEKQATERLVAVAAAGPFAVRNWQPGDRFRPLGLQGHRKKLQDLFVDRKVSRAERARIPLVLDARGRIVWVVGQGVGDDFRVTRGAASVLILKVRPFGG